MSSSSTSTHSSLVSPCPASRNRPYILDVKPNRARNAKCIRLQFPAIPDMHFLFPVEYVHTEPGKEKWLVRNPSDDADLFCSKQTLFFVCHALTVALKWPLHHFEPTKGKFDYAIVAHGLRVLADGPHELPGKSFEQVLAGHLVAEQCGWTCAASLLRRAQKMYEEGSLRSASFQDAYLEYFT